MVTLRQTTSRRALSRWVFFSQVSVGSVSQQQTLAFFCGPMYIHDNMSQGRDPQSVAAFLGLLVCQFAWGHAISQTEPVAPTAEKASPVVSAPASNKEQEAFVFELIHTKLRFENDGTETRE